MRAGPVERWDPRRVLDGRWTWRRISWRGSGDQIDQGRMRALRQMINKGAMNPIVRAVALRILRQYQVPARAQASQARAIQGWVQSNILWIPERGDQFFEPLRTLWTGGGDCDCHAALIGALLEAIRIPVKITIMQRRGIGVHVYCKVGLPAGFPRRWVCVETSLPVPFGWDPAQASPAEIRKML